MVEQHKDGYEHSIGSNPITINKFYKLKNCGLYSLMVEHPAHNGNNVGSNPTTINF